MKKVERPNEITFIAPQNPELIYDFNLNEIGIEDKDAQGQERKRRLIFKDHLCTHPKDSDLAQAAMKWYDQQFSRDDKGNIVTNDKGQPVLKTRPVPYSPYDAFENTLATTPIRVPLPNGEVIEVAPAELAKLVGKEFEAKPEDNKGVQGARTSNKKEGA